MTITENTAELWAPGSDTQALTNLAVEGLGSARAASSHPDQTSVDVLDNGLIRLRIPAMSGRRSVVITAPSQDAIALWTPGSTTNRSVITPSWVTPTTHGPFAGTFMGSLVARDSSSTISFGAIAGDGTVRARCGMVEESANLLVVVETDSHDNELTVIVNPAVMPFAESVRALGRALGLRRAEVEAANRKPVLCTWYSFHQDLSPTPVLEEAALAADLGFGTVIVDDGWQNDDTARGYGSTGDWEINADKIGDGFTFVEAMHELGMKVLWWVGTPFIGYRSHAYANASFSALYDEPGMEAAVLDPRVPTVRHRLAAQLAHLIRTTSADGLKLDFLERFAAHPDRAAVDSAAERAGVQLLDEILHELADAGQPAPMIEYREPYISPETIARGTMLRVGDCPLSPIQNRLGVIDLRLISGGIAVHSDPIMWAPEDSSERVAQHLLSSLFGVPQISVRIGDLPESQLAPLGHWIGFWNRHAATLLGESLSVSGVEQNYSAVQVRNESEVITARYGSTSLTAPVGDWTVWHIANADGDGVFVEGLDGISADIEIFDCTGQSISLARLGSGPLFRLPIPTGGRAEITRTAALAEAG